MKDYSRTKNTTLNALTGLVVQVVSILLNFVCRTVFIRVLGTEYLGINGLFSDILSLLSLAELGLDMSISYRLYKPVSVKDELQVRRYLIFLRSLYRVIAIIILFVGLLLIPFLHIFIADYDKLLTLGISAGFIFFLYLLQSVSSYAFFAYRSIALRVNQKQYIINETSLFIAISSNLVNIFILYFFENFIYYIISLTIFTILGNLINAVKATRRYPSYFKQEKSRLTSSEKKQIFKDCGALFFYKINNVIMKATDNVVLSSFVGLAIVGIYSNYVLVYSLFLKIYQTIYTSVEASMGNLFATDDIKKKYFFFELMNFVSIFLFGSAAVFITVESNEFICLWIGDAYILPQPFPFLIGFEIYLTGLKMNLAQIRHISGVFRQMWFRPIIGSVINLTLSILLVRLLGISGVIIGTLVAAIFANLTIDPIVIYKHVFSEGKRVSYYYIKNLKYLLVIGFIGIFCYYLCNYIIVGYGIFSFIIHCLLCILMVPILIIAMFWRTDVCTFFRTKTVLLVKQRRTKISNRY